MNDLTAEAPGGASYRLSVWPARPGHRLWRARIECMNGTHHEFQEPDDALLFLYHRLIRPGTESVCSEL
ncbi:hypothetical protein [Deinococcus arboris]|uniref:hypothetical protein n=1 Tax=Deinococcus arboris TaxID=2682977 RepID=UPI0018DC2B71|nr:hypothetical protein [Deinococcus arboris]